MKKRTILFPTVSAALVVGLVLCFVLVRNTSYAQVSLISRTAKSDPSAKPADSEKSMLSTRFGRAAGENTRLRSTLSWDFGGKSQSGWDIYAPLISKTIGVESAPDSPEFAAALSKWQSENGLPATGILDEATLGTLIKYWQSQRLGRSDFPGDDKLVSAPIGDFYDPTRSPDLLSLERETYAAYKRMIAAAARDLGGDLKFTRSGELAPGEKFLRIVSAYRSPQYQESLRQKQPNAGRGALAKFSAHSSGHAIDLYVGGEPVTTKDANRMIQVQTAAYKWLVKNAHRFGFYPYFYEPWHWEYVPGK